VAPHGDGGARATRVSVVNCFSRRKAGSQSKRSQQLQGDGMRGECGVRDYWSHLSKDCALSLLCTSARIPYIV
jgi:hypothetical protein